MPGNKFIYGEHDVQALSFWSTEDGARVEICNIVTRTEKAGGSKFERSSRGDSMYLFESDDMSPWYNIEQLDKAY